MAKNVNGRKTIWFSDIVEINDTLIAPKKRASMDNLLLNMFGDVPIVTKTWIAGVVVLAVCINLNLLDYTKVIYSYDLTFKKGQYLRLPYSLLDYGLFDWGSIFNFFVAIGFLSALENSIAKRGRYLWMLCVITMLIVVMSRWMQPLSSLGYTLHQNLVYYKIRRDIQANIQLPGGFNVSPLLFPLYTNARMYLSLPVSFGEILVNFLPGHMYFFVEDALSKIYNLDLGKPPNEWFSRPTEEPHGQEQERANGAARMHAQD